jgi:hypothetical protein
MQSLVGYVSGFDIQCDRSGDGKVHVHSQYGGTVHLNDDRVIQYGGASLMLSSDAAGRYRVYFFDSALLAEPKKIAGMMPRVFTNKRSVSISVDRVTDMQPGVYPGGLAVIGDIEVPAADTKKGKPIDLRERANLLRIIRALSAMAGLPDRGATASIAKQLEELGFLKPEEATIRKFISEARNLEPDKPL